MTRIDSMQRKQKTADSAFDTKKADDYENLQLIEREINKSASFGIK